jgi:SAM-dependent methyltransferase
MMHGQVFHAPVERPSRVLEVGAGTGYVTRHLASTFPDAEVVGLDLSAVPAEGKTNAVFFQGDIMDDGVVAGPFDFIYSRLLVFGIRDWPAYISRAWDLLPPGGWLELQELNASVAFDGNDTAILTDVTFMKEQRAAFASKGVDMGCAPKLEGYLKDQGFVDVSAKKFRWMHGPWEGHPETLALARATAKYNAPANFAAYKRVLGHTKTAVQLDEVREQMMEYLGWSEDGKHHDFWVVCGRKPRQ